jgi:glycerol uptake facilitator-like aquaporin
VLFETIGPRVDNTVIRSRQGIVSEFLGTAMLLAAVVGSGIMGERLSSGNAAVALLANSIATGAMLVVLILTFGPLSGAHFNPAVTLVMAVRGEIGGTQVLSYLTAQFSGAFVGVSAANVMFELPPLFLSHHVRAGGAQFFSECVATFGLLIVVLVGETFRPKSIAYAVAGYITAAYWFTSSTSFANPAVTLARAFSDTFAGIRLTDVPAFVVAQLCGAGAALALFRFLVRKETA